MRVCSYLGWVGAAAPVHLCAGLLTLWGCALVAGLTDFSSETEFASSQSSKYPNTQSVVPYQPSNINVLEIGTNWFFLSWLAPYDGGSTVTHYEVRTPTSLLLLPTKSLDCSCVCCDMLSFYAARSD